jgi:hypothetical protein
VVMESKYKENSLIFRGTYLKKQAD